MGNSVGRPPRFKSVAELEELVGNWKAEFEEGGKFVNDIPDVEHFCDYAGVWRDLLSEYEKKEEFADAIKSVKNWMYLKKKQLAMQNKMNATVYIFDAKNNHGYVDKTEQDVTSKGEQLNQPVDANILNQFMMKVKEDTKQ